MLARIGRAEEYVRQILEEQEKQDGNTATDTAAAIE